MVDKTSAGPSPLVGRAAEISRLERHARSSPRQERVLLVLGDAGIGKTSLLDHTASRALQADTSVLRVAATESEAHLPFAGLHRLLQPVLPKIASLPGPKASALRSALGLERQPAGSERLLTSVAFLDLLAELSAHQPVLVLIDDAQLLDRSSRDILAFAGHRLGTERVAIIAAARGILPPPGFGQRFPEIRLRPLTTAEAGQLLDLQPCPPAGHARTLVLDQAGGNPMALIELTRAIAADGAAGHRWSAEPIPLTDRLTALISSQLATLPPETRDALLMAAVAENVDPASARILTAQAIEALAPAEALDLVTVDRAGVRFTHPLVRSAIYHGAPFAQRAHAHRQLAAALTGQPDRQAWHLAAATLQPDDHVADLLAATASQAQQRGGAAAAAAALERAAELSPGLETQARRLVCAASVAVSTGQANWVQELATQALAITSDPELRLRAQQSVGWALAWSSQHAAALPALVAVARQACEQNLPMAWNALATASTVAYQSGEPGAVHSVRDTLAHLEQSACGLSHQPDLQADIDASRLWIAASTRGYGDAREDARIPDPASLSRYGESPVSKSGAAAWLLDRPEAAVSLLQAAIQLLRVPELRGASGGSLSALGWACVDAGRWEEALDAAAEADDLGTAYQMAIVSASAHLITGTIRAARGAGAKARASIKAALRCDPEQCRSVLARARHALGISALGDGDYVVAYGQRRPLFGDDGSPLHFHVSYLAVADLAIAAARSDRAMEGRELLARIEERVGASASPRLDQLLNWAHAALAEPPHSEGHFAKGLADPAGDQWPFERARLSLDYGGWLRRQRRINEAKGRLASALTAFRQLQAQPWQQKAEAELRACGVGLAASAPGVIAMLTPQQQQIVELAARGYTNREIAERMFLSPRTIASHLYRCFPALGVSSRNQLRDVIDQVPAARDDLLPELT
jgi:DNA-binding CsgD family transcriptional regulator